VHEGDRESLSDEQRGERAESLNDRGNELRERGVAREAEDAYREAARLLPEWSAPRYNLGLIYKYEGRWAESLEENRAAAELDPSDQATWWNLGIAATALGRWRTAREAWRGCGIDVPDGEGPLLMQLGQVPIRLTGRQREVVWCDRIDPARAIVRNVPLPQSGHAWGDEVLHDGAANGYRTLRGREVHVFDELEVLRRSPYRTWEVQLEAVGPGEVELLEQVADAKEGSAEDWSVSVRWLCRQCSEGRPDHEHDQELGGVRAAVGIGVAALDEMHLDAILDSWRSQAVSGFVLSRREVTPSGR
jgi:hypothetical protein